MSNRLLLFIIGILVGVIAGGVVVFYTTGSSVKNIFVVNEEKAQTVPVSEPVEEKPKVKTPTKNKTANTYPEKSKPKPNPQKVTTPRIEEEELIILPDINSDEDIVVKTDELLKSYTIPVIFSTAPAEPDSAIESVSGVKEDKTVQNIRVEYWESPINYRGYKMNKNKLVLYGLPEADDVKIVNLSGSFILKHFQKYYILHTSAEFRPYEYLIDPEIRKRVDEL